MDSTRHDLDEPHPAASGLVPGTDAGAGVRLVAGRYRLVAELGRGGMGVVWLAEDQLVGRQVAVKELRPLPGLSRAERETHMHRALQEARSAARVDHPGAVALFDVLPTTADDDAVYLIMELVQGPTLAQVIAQQGRLDEATVADFGVQLLSVLDAAHALGVVHRDIKPANVLIAAGGQLKLTDFGIAHTMGDLRLTRSGVMGTQAYLAPELFESAPITPAADVWSLGATLYAAAEGHGPFDRETTGATLRAILIDDPPVPHCSPALAAALAGMLQRDPAQRASTGQARTALREAAQLAPPPPVSADPPPGADGAPSASPPQPRWAELLTTRSPAPPPAPPPPHRAPQPPPPSQPSPAGPHRRTAAIVAAIAVVLLAVITGGILATSHPSTPPSRPGATAQKPSPSRGAPQPSAPAIHSLTATLTDPQGKVGSEGVQSLAFSPDGKTLATGDGAGLIYLWSTATDSVTATVKDPNTGAEVSALAFSPDSQTLALGDVIGGTYLWSTATRSFTGNLLSSHISQTGWVTFSSDGQVLANAEGSEPSFYLWNAATQKITAKLRDPNSLDANYGVFSPDGQTLAIADDNGATYLWNVATRSITATLVAPHDGGVTWAAFSADGQVLATSDTDGRVYLWNAVTHSLTATLAGPRGKSYVNWLALSPDGRTLATAYLTKSYSNSSTVYLWSTTSGKIIGTLTDPRSQGVQAGAFSPDGHMLAIADDNGRTYLWQVPTGG